jgi:hypothetical protein
MESRNTSNLAKIVADTCAAAKIDMIGGLPAWPVAGDVGVGFICTPASLDDLAWLAHVAEPVRPSALSFFGRGSMQKAQNSLKAYDKKNKSANDNARQNEAQTAFAGTFNGATESKFNDSSTIRDEAVRQFVSTKVKAYAASKGMDTDEKTLETLRKDIETKPKTAEAYKASIAALVDSVSQARTYVVSRKNAVDGVEIDTSDFPL